MTKRAAPKITKDAPKGEDVDLVQDDVRLPDGTRLTDDLVSWTTSNTRVADPPSLANRQNRRE